jgi:glucosyl-3-phosphoglycerate synthase
MTKRYGADALDPSVIAAAKGSSTVSVIIPAKDEAKTIGSVLEAVMPHCSTGLVDEVLVVDDGSCDGTGELARAAGASVLALEGQGGKGEAMAAGAAAATGELLVFLDADVENTTADYVPRLLGPLLLDPEVMLVKAYYERPFGDAPTGGGRVTELCARPALALLFPELAELRQPLAGETGLRREVLEVVSLDTGYRVEMALLIDVGTRFGGAAVAEVDLGIRIHRNRPLSELGPMATEVLAVALERAGARS